MEHYNIDDIYLELIKQLFEEGKTVGNTLELSNVKFVLKSVGGNRTPILNLTDRNFSIEYLLAELVWYFSGDNSMKFISKFGSIWEKLSDDGETNNSAYGYILQQKHGFNQVDKIIELLKIDPNSRRAVLNLNVPNKKVIETHDEPCTIALQFLLREDKLDCTVMMRSNDIWFGLPYDVVFFVELQKYIAKQLDVHAGDYTHFAVSLHMYEKDFARAALILQRKVTDYWSKSHRDLNINMLIKNAKEIRKMIDADNFTKEEFMEIMKNFGILGKQNE